VTLEEAKRDGKTSGRLLSCGLVILPPFLLPPSWLIITCIIATFYPPQERKEMRKTKKKASRNGSPKSKVRGERF